MFGVSDSMGSDKPQKTPLQAVLPVSDAELRWQTMYRQDSMLTHYRRLKVFNGCKLELDKIKSKKHTGLLGGIKLARRSKYISFLSHLQIVVMCSAEDHAGIVLAGVLPKEETSAYRQYR